MQNKYLIISIIVVLILISTHNKAQVEDPRLRNLNEKIEKLTNEYQQQKIFIQFDQPFYTTQDVIKFKAFVLNYSNLLPDTISTNLYFEFINSDGVLNHISLLRLEDGIAVARIELNDTIPPDVYLFRAYTNWSKTRQPIFFLPVSRNGNEYCREKALH